MAALPAAHPGPMGAGTERFKALAPVARLTPYDTHTPVFRLEMKYLPSVERIVTPAKRTLAAG